MEQEEYIRPAVNVHINKSFKMEPIVRDSFFVHAVSDTHILTQNKPYDFVRVSHFGTFSSDHDAN